MTTRDQIIGGGQALDDLLKTLPAKLQKNITRTALRAGAAVLLAEAKRNVPTDSGALARTLRISTRNKAGLVSASVKAGGKHKGADVFYAHMVEYGTKPHKILPKKQGGVMQFGGIKTRMVNHPGTTARPFMRPAVDAKFIESVNAVREKIRERLAHNGLNVPDSTPAADGDE